MQTGGLLKDYTVEDHGPVGFSRITEYRPQITAEYSGADVIDAVSGVIIGVTVPFQLTGPQAMGMVPVHSIASQWPLLEYMVAGADCTPGRDPGERDITISTEEADGAQPARLSHGDLIRLIGHGMQIPQLAEAPSRRGRHKNIPL